MQVAAAATFPVATREQPCLADQASSSSSGPCLSAKRTCIAAESAPPRNERVPVTLCSQPPEGSFCSSQSAFAVELCAGTAGLSAKLWGHGLPVDHARNRHLQGAPCVVLDLAQDSGWVVLYQLLEQGKIFYVHGAPPCGTASRAREKPLPLFLKQRGVHEPRQLRSTAFPGGLPGLGVEDQLRVEHANCLYHRMVAVLAACETKWFSGALRTPRRRTFGRYQKW